MFVCPECGSSYSGPGVCTQDGAALADSLTEPLLGQTVGSYRVAKLLGAGGMGRVYLGVHPSIGSRVAIKLLSQECAQHPTLVERFFAEARAVNVIRHESIVNVLDLANLADGRPYIVMEYLAGAPLSAIIKARGALPFGGFTRVMVEVLSALQAAHDNGVVHRDLKPDNIYVLSSGRAKVLDFGVAKLKPEAGAVTDATRTGSLLGTPHYMSPEQARGMPVDYRSDLYSVGVILFEGITGQRPFNTPTLYDLLKAHVELQPPSPRALRPDLLPAYEAVLLRALEKDPARRQQSARELAHALEQVSQYLPPESWENLGATAAHLSGTKHEPVSGHFTPHSNQPSGQPPAPTVNQSFVTSPPTAPSHGSVSAVAQSTPGLGSYSGTAAPVAKKRSSWPLILGLGAALLLVGGGLAAFLGLYYLSPDTPATTALPAAKPTKVGWEKSKPAGFSAKAFDVSKNRQEAEKRARKHFSDAKLVGMHAWGVDKQGTVDFTLDRRYGAVYRFYSPTKAAAASSTSCEIWVHVDQGGIASYLSPSDSCEPQGTLQPRCSMKEMFKKSASVKAERKDFHFMNRGPQSVWMIQVGQAHANLADDC